MRNSDIKAANGRIIETSKLDVLDDCITQVEQVQKKLDSLGNSMASIHLSQALESLRAHRVRVASGLE